MVIGDSCLTSLARLLLLSYVSGLEAKPIGVLQKVSCVGLQRAVRQSKILRLVKLRFNNEWPFCERVENDHGISIHAFAISLACLICS
jgi:hypothetical protein